MNLADFFLLTSSCTFLFLKVAIIILGSLEHHYCFYIDTQFTTVSFAQKQEVTTKNRFAGMGRGDDG